MISLLDFSRLTLLIVVLAFSVQANERAKRIVRERRIQREQRMTKRMESTDLEVTGRGETHHDGDTSQPSGLYAEECE
ncbi:MAG: hypothetical protein QM762_24775 [Chryseolinea sp.]